MSSGSDSDSDLTPKLGSFKRPNKTGKVNETISIDLTETQEVHGPRPPDRLPLPGRQGPPIPGRRGPTGPPAPSGSGPRLHIRPGASSLNQQGSESDEADANDVNVVNVISQTLAKYLQSPAENGAGNEEMKKLLTTSNKDELHQPLIQFLLTSIAKLASENEVLKLQQEGRKLVDATIADPATADHVNRELDIKGISLNDSPPLMYETVHRVTCTGSSDYYLDPPRMFKGDKISDHLRGRQGIEDAYSFLQSQSNLHLAFLEAAIYRCRCNHGLNYHLMVGYKNGKLIHDSPLAKSYSKAIILGIDLWKALNTILEKHPGRFPGFKTPLRPQVYQPYLLHYFHNRTFLELVNDSDLSDQDCGRVELLCKWFEQNMRDDWDEAEELFSKGKVNAKHHNKLFRPGDIVVQKDENGEHEAFKIRDYPWKSATDETANMFCWTYNGNFQQIDSSLILKDEAVGIDETEREREISSLDTYPIQYAKGLREKLIARGTKFWRYRKASHVSFVDIQPNEGSHEQETRDHRFMIDYKTYQTLHPYRSIFKNQSMDKTNESVNMDGPPDDDFLVLLPPRIHAFDLTGKTWKHLRVDHFTDVTWEKGSFERLAIPPKTKELVQAAVMSHGQKPSVQADLISDKGQGLLILLHGGPGTGKTLTAESIAEEQKRPLYRVTCGDIGVEPRDVEDYLRTVLAIGKAWRCVVLLDEADVFLEERRNNDPTQNAIVSIFLRVLEYYDGIMILTTNRVGTFDEAFKSRIHLALHYRDLNEEQRLKIWSNCFHLLSRSEERVDFEDLNLNVKKLAREDLNGRQIRNVVTLARYLARFRKEMMVYKHVQDAVESVVDFDKYLLDVRGSDELFARQARIR